MSVGPISERNAAEKNDEKTVKDLERQNDFTVCVSVPNIEKTAPMNF